MDIKTLCLGVLMCGDASGYTIRKWFEEGPFAHFHEAGFGSIYPALRRLNEDGDILVVEQPADGRAEKKIYRITPAGAQRFLADLHRRPPADKIRSDFLFVLFFGHLLPCRHLEGLIEERLVWYREQIAAMESRQEAPDFVRQPVGTRFVHDFGLAVYRAAAEFLETHRQQFRLHVLESPDPGPPPSTVSSAISEISAISDVSAGAVRS